MSLPTTTDGYALGPDDGEALWFNGALGILKATAAQTGGRFTAYELRLPEGFAAPLHAHKNEDEFFLVLSGRIRLQHGDEVIEAVPVLSRLHPPGDRALLPRGQRGSEAAAHVRPRRGRGVLP